MSRRGFGGMVWVGDLPSAISQNAQRLSVFLSLTELAEFTELKFFVSGFAGTKTIVLLCGLRGLCERHHFL